MLFLDGVYVDRLDRSTRFHRVSSPTTRELTQLTRTIARRVGRYLERQGLLEQDADDCTPAIRHAAMTCIRGENMHGEHALQEPRISPRDNREFFSRIKGRIGGAGAKMEFMEGLNLVPFRVCPSNSLWRGLFRPRCLVRGRTIFILSF